MDKNKVAKELVAVAKELTAGIKDMNVRASYVIKQPVFLADIKRAMESIEEDAFSASSEIRQLMNKEFYVRGEKTQLWASLKFDDRYMFSGDFNELRIWKLGKVSYNDAFESDVKKILRHNSIGTSR